jgi:CheY-like chemotaxis protein
MDCQSVLVVEDDEGIRNTLRFAIECEGFQVYAAENGKEALEILREIPKPCIILLDLMMPVMNGWEFFEAAQKSEAFATIPVVLVTAFGERAEAIQSKGILKKPVDLNLLFKTIRRWCSDEAQSTPSKAG